jgi:uncharacterized membrane protein
MRKSLALDLVTLALFALVVAFTAQAYAGLPARMPTHFGIDGRPNGWMPRELGAWVLPGFAALIGVVTRVTSALVAVKRAGVETPLRIVGALVVVILGAAQVMMLDAATSKTQQISNLIWLPALAGVVVVPLVMWKMTPRAA